MVTELLRGKWEGQGKSCVEILNGAKLSSIWKRSETGKLLVNFPIIRFVSVTMDSFSLPKVQASKSFFKISSDFERFV